MLKTMCQQCLFDHHGCLGRPTALLRFCVSQLFVVIINTRDNQLIQRKRLVGFIFLEVSVHDLLVQMQVSVAWREHGQVQNCSPHSQGAKEKEERAGVPHFLQRHVPSNDLKTSHEALSLQGFTDS